MGYYLELGLPSPFTATVVLLPGDEALCSCDLRVTVADGDDVEITMPSRFETVTELVKVLKDKRPGR
jgi:hypothetical protein